MKYGIYCVRDVKTGYLSPILDTNDETAKRNFMTQVKNAEINPTMFFNKSDFSLYKLAEFDTVDGSIILLNDSPRHLVDAVFVDNEKE